MVLKFPRERRSTTHGNTRWFRGLWIYTFMARARDVMEASSDALETVTATVAKHGTTTLIATTVSAPVDETCKSLEGIARYIESDANRRAPSAIRAQMQGIHLEGPFISAARRG